MNKFFKTKNYFIAIISLLPLGHLAQDLRYKWGASLAINSIQAQIEIPLMTSIGSISTGAGAVIVDADGNIIAKGNRTDKSFSFSIVPKYYINEEFILRLELGMTTLSLKANPDIKSAFDHQVATQEVNTKMFRYTPGIQWIFLKKKKIESYCGITASFVDYDKINVDVYSENRELVTDTIQSWLRKKETTPGGFAIGAGAFAGFNIYLQKHISIGAELSSTAFYYKLGGETVGEHSEQVPPNPVYKYTTTFANSYRGFKISKIISSFNISIWF